MLFPAARGGDHRRARAPGAASVRDARDSSDVLHERNLGVTAEAFENVAAHEDRLIAGGDTGERRAQVHAALDDAIGGPRAVETDIETAPEMTGLDRRAHVAQRLRRQARPRAGTAECRSGLRRPAGVHLRRVATRAVSSKRIRGWFRTMSRVGIIAAAIDDDDLVRPLFQNPGERGVEDAGLVQHR